MSPLIKKFLSYRPIRFLISGGIGAVVHIGMVFVLVHLLSVWYRYATIIGFLSAVGLSFVMQKFFTFRDERKEVLRVQSSLFLLIASFNLVLNSTLMYIFVEHAKLMPVIAQIATALLIALWSYYAYNKLFRSRQYAMPLEDDLKE